jgi:hypothetical protein
MESLPLWKLEFPYFPINDIPDLGADWEDVSWHNDACPCFYNQRLNLFAWIEPKDRSLWELDTKDARILIIKGDRNRELPNHDFEPLVSGEDWEDIAHALKDSKLERDWICDRWTKRLGIGFHPDSEGFDIKGFSYEEAAEFDNDMERLFQISDDPYQDGLEAFQRANLI